MRVRHHEDLQLLLLPLVSFIRHLPPLLPRTSVYVLELDPIVQILRSDIHDGGDGERIVYVSPVDDTLPRLHESVGSGGGGGGGEEAGGDRFRDAEVEEREEEEEEGDGESDEEEVGEEEVYESCSFPWFSIDREFGFG